MKVAPLLGDLRTKGGTLITFSNTTDDFSYLLSNSDITITPSHFALLKLPQWENTTDQSMFYDGTNFTTAITDANSVFPKVIQNYIENMLSASESERTDNSLGNYSESAFFKMLRTLGGIEFSTTGTVDIGGVTHNVYEEDLTSNEQVVQYIGRTNMINHRKDDDGNEYVETFIHIPTEEGTMTNIRFVPKVHVTHASSLIPQGGGTPYTSGLDSYIGTDQVEAIYDTVTNEYEVGNDLDDLGIDWDYSLENANTKQGDFEFNAILLYYTADSKSGAVDSQINTWGLHLLDDFNSSVGGVQSLNTQTKYQPDNIQSGNAFNFKFNLGFSAGTFNISTTTNSDFSFNLYLDALDKINNITSEYQRLQSEWQSLQQTIINFSSAIGNYNTIKDSLDTISTLQSDVQSLKNWQNSSGGFRISNEELFKLFQDTNNALQNSSGGDINIYPILSSRAFLPSVVDASNLIVEYNGSYYQYNQSTQQWDLTTITP
jgi:hypothetical protein